METPANARAHAALRDNRDGDAHHKISTRLLRFARNDISI
jgi:hypothetical protein